MQIIYLNWYYMHYIWNSVSSCFLLLQAVEVVIEYMCDSLHSEVVGHELLAVVKECLLEEWGTGDWSAVSAVICFGGDKMVCAGIRICITGC